MSISTETLRINGQRLNTTLQSTCSSWGALLKSTGMRRLALSQEDKEVRDWLVQECKSLGCEVKIDKMGNIFAMRPGRSKDHKSIGMGSHLDTQPAGELPDASSHSAGLTEIRRTIRWNIRSTSCSRSLTNIAREQYPDVLPRSPNRLDKRRRCSVSWSNDVFWGMVY
jgi:hypothetical protein